jgi:hypothetical protein
MRASMRMTTHDPRTRLLLEAPIVPTLLRLAAHDGQPVAAPYLTSGSAGIIQGNT